MSEKQKPQAELLAERRPLLAELILSDDLTRAGELYHDKGLEHSAVLPGAYGATDTLLLGGQRRTIYFTATLIHDPSGERIGAIETIQDITEQKLAERAVIETQAKLRSRIKELYCLFSISEIAEKSGDSVERFLGRVVGLLPTALSESSSGYARIQFRDHEFKTADFLESPANVTAEIRINEEVAGCVSIGYPPQSGTGDNCSSAEIYRSD